MHNIAVVNSDIDWVNMGNPALRSDACAAWYGYLGRRSHERCHNWLVRGAFPESNKVVEPTDADGGPLGSAIRERRLFANMTLVELAAKAGLSQPFLSQVENGRARPSLMSLHQIAQALDTTPQAFFGGPTADSVTWTLVRAKEVQVLPVESDKLPSTCHVLLGGDAPFHVLEFDGLPSEFLDYFEHDGFEAVYVIRGRAEIDVGGSISELRAGDSMSYPARIPHRLRAVGKRPVKVLLIETKVAALQDRRPALHAPQKKAKRVVGTKLGQPSLVLAPTAKAAKAAKAAKVRTPAEEP